MIKSLTLLKLKMMKNQKLIKKKKKPSNTIMPMNGIFAIQGKTQEHSNKINHHVIQNINIYM